MISEQNPDPIVEAVDRWKRRVIAIVVLCGTIIVGAAILVLESSLLIHALDLPR